MKAVRPEYTDDDVLVQWLVDRFAEEREVLEKRHSKIVADFKEYQSVRRTAFEPTPPCAVVPVPSLPDDNGRAIVESAKDKVGCEVETSPDFDNSLSGKSGVEHHRPSSTSASIKTPISFVMPKAKVPKTRLAGLVTHRYFELFFAALIAANMLFMVLDMQYHGEEVGHKIEYEGFVDATTRPEVMDAMDQADWVFGIMYTVEIVLKMIGLRSAFFGVWNVFDTIVVATFYFEKVARMHIPIDAMILRLFRLLKVLRFLRLVHEIAGFGQLLLMVTALKGSLRMLAWASLLLLGLQTICALILNQFLNELVVENGQFSIATRLKCFKYFGTFSRSVFSIFELTLGNWVVISRFLVEDVHTAFIIFALGYKLTLGFAVVGVVNACFIKETFKVVATDRNMMVIEKSDEKRVFERELLRFMTAADTSSDGSLTQQEFVEVCADANVKAWLAAQGLDASDAGKLFRLMSGGAAAMSDTELLKGVAKLKGPAKSLALAESKVERTEQKCEILQQVHRIEERLIYIQSQWEKINDSENALLHLSL